MKQKIELIGIKNFVGPYILGQINEMSKNITNEMLTERALIVLNSYPDFKIVRKFKIFKKKVKIDKRTALRDKDTLIDLNSVMWTYSSEDKTWSILNTDAKQ